MEEAQVLKLPAKMMVLTLQQVLQNETIMVTIVKKYGHLMKVMSLLTMTMAITKILIKTLPNRY